MKLRLPPCLGPRARGRRLLFLLLAMGGVGPLFACFGPDYWSVHFHGLRPDFFQMPQPWRGVPEEKRALPPPSDNWADGDERSMRQEELRRAVAISRAVRAEAAGQFRLATTVWERYQRDRLRADPWEVADGQEPLQTSALDDRLAALRAWRGPQDTPDLRAYLRARDLVSAGKYSRAVPLLGRLRQAPYRERAKYLRASLVFLAGPPEAGVVVLRAYRARHPRDPLARYMLGRSLFRLIRIDEKVDGRKLAPDRRRRLLREALAAYAACAAGQPSGPLAEDARGMAAACLYRLGDRVAALARYCEQLAALPPGRDNHFAFLSARDCLHRMSLAEHRAFQDRTRSRPELAAVYLDLHLHFARPGLRGCENLGRFALAVLARHPKAALSGRLLTRLAIIEGRLGRWERAERLATAAIARCGPGGYRDQARWQRAQALRQLHRPREALAEYERLAEVASVPNLRRGAHEAAAILSEECGDLPDALRHYFALEYRPDYAYLIDCVASQDALRAFLCRFPRHPRAPLVRYSLGFRQLRAGQYDAAARTFASLGPWLAVAEKAYDYRNSEEQREPLWPPLKLARFMAAAARREAAARTDSAKARAAYCRARVLFHQRYLALYNGALWKGGRVGTLDFYGPEGIVTRMTPLSASERQVYDRYHREHACLYQALLIFERVARQYPHTPEAPKALVSAAHCYDMLSTMDHYWTKHVQYSGMSDRLYRRVQREYPRYPLVRAAVKQGGRVSSDGVQRNAAGERSGG
jgi:tetratricopeptide (TPR) repeat protein